MAFCLHAWWTSTCAFNNNIVPCMSNIWEYHKDQRRRKNIYNWYEIRQIVIYKIVIYITQTRVQIWIKQTLVQINFVHECLILWTGWNKQFFCVFGCNVDNWGLLKSRYVINCWIHLLHKGGLCRFVC